MISRTTHPFIRIGETFINIAQIAYVAFDDYDLSGDKCISIYFTALAPEGYNMVLRFRDDKAQAIRDHLFGAFSVATVQHVNLPQMEPQP